jgi:uroporphyrinogen-III synthase
LKNSYNKKYLYHGFEKMSKNYKESKKTIAITRPYNRMDEGVEIVKSYGAEPFIAPTLELKLVNTNTLKNLIKVANKLDWLIFTSPTSLESIFNFYPDFKEKLSDECKIVAIGTKTKEKSNEYGVEIDLIPKNYTAEGILESFKDIDVKNKLIGIPRTLDARLVLPDKLKERGANVLIAEAYKSILPADTLRIEVLISKILNNEIDAITFTSPLTVKNLFKVAVDDQKNELINKLSTSVLTVAIGPVTHEVIEEYGITSSIYPNQYTVKNMMELLFDSL